MSRIDEITVMDNAEFDNVEHRVCVLGWPVAFALGLILWAGLLFLAL